MRRASRSRWYSSILASLVVLAACGPDIQTPAENQPVTPPGPIMPVDAGTNEYNLIDRTDPHGGPACISTNVCLLQINSAWWEHPVDANVGTGNLNPFWDTHNSPTSECFNTDAATLPLDCARSAWTNALPLQVVPVFFFDPPGAPPPVLVRELVWDMNEPNSSPQTAQISIDFFRVYLCAQQPAPPAPPPPLTVNPATFSTVAQVEANCDRVYDIEVGGVSSGTQGVGLAWDGSTQGSGSDLDYRILIPETLFEAANQVGVQSCPYDPAGPNCGLFVIVHAHLGGKTGTGVDANVNWQTSGGFEEMSTVERPVPARKSGVKFNDLDGDGVKDAGEPGLAGWTIFVETINHNGVLDAGEPFDVTDATGAYQINAIIAGTWSVHEVPQAGWTCSFPATTDTHGCVYVEVFEDGDVLTDNDFGNFAQGTKSGTKFEDEDADGVKEAGDAGLADWTINAYADTDGDGVLDATEYAAGAEDTDDTDATGAYELSLDPGKYVVCEETESAAWTQSAPNNTICAAGAATLEPGGWAITITSGSTDTGNDFGNFQNGTKSGTKFEDLDADGTDDGELEAGLANWTINAYADTDQDGVLDATEYAAGAAATDETDATGAYSLSLAPGGTNAGKYVVCEVTESAAWTQSAPNNTICAAGAATLEPGGWAITITSGSTDTGNDFGNFRNGTKTGTKFNDADSDGVFDAGEAVLSGWTINAYADTDGDGVLDAGEFAAGATATDGTDATGAYELSLAPGKYIVCEVAQVGWNQTAPANTVCLAGSPTLANGGWAITITSGDTDSGNHFGNVQPPADTETAYARGTGGATCFIDLGISNNWGWGITFLKSDLPVTFDVYAGAGGCNISGLSPIGTVTVFIDGGVIKVRFQITTGTLESVHVFISSTQPFPSPVSPGQFPFKADPTTNDFTITTIGSGGAPTTLYRFIAHAVVSGLP